MMNVAFRVPVPVLGVAAALVAGVCGAAQADGPSGQVAVTLWTAGDAGAARAFVVHRRDVDVTADGGLRFAGVAETLDAATAVLRSLTDPGAAVVEQRVLGDRRAPDALINQQVGKTVTVILARGEVQGVLRSVSLAYLGIETDGAGGKQLELVRRGDQILGLRFAAAGLATEPTLQWMLSGARPGRHRVELSYQADGLYWLPSYTAVLDGDAVDFNAWATIANLAGLALDGAELTLMASSPSGPVAFKLPRPVTLGADQSLQVELTPRRVAVKAQRVTLFMSDVDRSSDFSEAPAIDCYGFAPPAAQAHQMLEFDGAGVALPPGSLRVMRRTAGGVVLDREAPFQVDGGTGMIRIETAVSEQITGQRTQVSCEGDDTSRSLREEIAVEVENKGKAAVDVVLREYLFRWRNWKIVSEDVKGIAAGPQLREYRLKLPPGSSRTVRYAVVYSW